MIENIPTNNQKPIIMTSIIGIAWNKSTHILNLEINAYLLFSIAIIIFITILSFIFVRNNSAQIIEIGVEISGVPKATFKLKRDYSNLYIANRIYVELITRKVTLPFEENKDVIIEVYDSWYDLFTLIREEMKTIPGHFLQKKHSGAALVALTTTILNLGLRPHLTTHQATFRRWYEAALKDTKLAQLSPQEIQEQYPKYQELVKNIQKANLVLVDYTNNLKLFIEGK